MPHRLAYLVGAWDVPGPGLGVAQNSLRGRAEAGDVAQLGEVSVDGLESSCDVCIETVVEFAHDLQAACRDLGIGEHAVATWRLWIRHCVHEGVLLQVYQGAKEVVPEREAESPVATELGFDSSGHCCRPLSDAHFGRIGVAGPAAR